MPLTSGAPPVPDRTEIQPPSPLAAPVVAARGAQGRQEKAIQSIQVMRGLAAAAVAVYHTHVILEQPRYGGIESFGAIASTGWLGVNFFFVLSGFIILHAHSMDIGRPARAPRYVWKRFTRVYPVYWACLTAFLVAAWLGLGNAQFSWQPLNLLSAYVLVQLTDTLSLPLQVAWTLFHEVRFYAIFTLLIISRPLGLAAILAWAVGIGVANISGTPGAISLFHMWASYFLFGMASQILFRRMDARWGLPLFLLGIGLLAACWSGGLVTRRMAEAGPTALLALAMPFCLILLGGALWERAVNWQPSRLLLLLGDASYSVYLVHSAAITLTGTITQKFASGLLPAPLLFVIAALVSIAAGIAVHLVVERPVMAMARRASASRANNISSHHAG